MKTLISYSSKTGNTKKVAEAIHEKLQGDLFDIVHGNDVDLKDYDKVIFGFWVDKGGPDAKAKVFMEQIANKKVGVFFTLGAYPDSDHAKDVMEKTIDQLEKQGNTVMAHFCCMGKIDPKLTAMFEKLGDDSPHRMTDERRKRHEEAAKHPNDEDLIKAQDAFRCMI
ncbi:MAG: flavodoxin family protein [Tissierellia bacterium]|nr:flavodoxin family protein [Tissierellia bacterium]